MTFSTSPDQVAISLYNERVYRLHRYWLDCLLIKRFAAKKAEQKTETNTNVRRSSICWRGRRELITDVRNQKSWLWRHCRRRAIYWLLRSPSQTCHAKPKLKSTGAGRYQLLSRWWDAYRKQLGLKDFSPKSQDAVALQQIKERGALPMIDRGDIRQAIDRCSNIWASLPGAGYGQFATRPTAWLQNSKKRAERSERLMYEQSHRDYSALVIRIIVCLSWAVNHYR